MSDGIQIISDGTVQGTAILVDGLPLGGEAHVMWSFSPEGRAARLVMDLRDIALLSADKDGHPGHLREIAS